MAIDAITPIPTPDGWVLASSVRPGDMIFAKNGELQPVKTTQVYIPRECYRVEFSDGVRIVGDKNLKFALQDQKWRDNQVKWFKNQGNRYAKSRFRRPLKVKTAAELAKEPLKKPRSSLWALQAASALKYPHVDLPVPPYVFGLWLGTVTASGTNTVREMDFEMVKKKARQFGYYLTRNWRYFFFRPGIRESFIHARAFLPDGIPQQYQEASLDSRRELLEGLVDSKKIYTDASLKSRYKVYDKWKAIRQIQQLLEGLGYSTWIAKVDDLGSYMLTFDLENTNPAKNRRFLSKVEKINPRQCVHIVTDDDFVVGEGFLAVC